MFTTTEIKNHYLAADNHLAAVTGLMAYQGLHWFDACSTVNGWRIEKRDYIKSLEESKKLAALAIRAAKNRKRWGDYATNRFIKKNHIPARVMTAAYRLEYLKQSAERMV